MHPSLMAGIARRSLQAALLVAMFAGAGSAQAQLDPKALAYLPLDQVKWTDNANGSKQSVVVGDPEKPGMYVVLYIWPAGKMSRPHFHPNDRFITVLKGTWWVGTGPKFDPASTVPMRAGTFVTHFGKQIHYDGAKDEDAYLQIVGMGPGTSTPAETK
jgi:quercetin dioxygenase-like cupin family protein